MASTGDRGDIGQAQHAAGPLGPQGADLAVASGGVVVAGGGGQAEVHSVVDQQAGPVDVADRIHLGGPAVDQGQ